MCSFVIIIVYVKFNNVYFTDFLVPVFFVDYVIDSFEGDIPYIKSDKNTVIKHKYNEDNKYLILIMFVLISQIFLWKSPSGAE